MEFDYRAFVSFVQIRGKRSVTDGIISIEFYNDLSSIIESSRKSAYQMVDRILVIRNWLLGKRIAEKELSGTHADRYGEKIISELARTLTKQYGLFPERTTPL